MQTMKNFLLITLFFSATAMAAGPLPDPKLTPGAINPEVTQENINDTICVRGWTKTIRPKVSYTNKLKLQQMAELGLLGDPHDYEEDHLISLELGGHPTDPHNLWPEPWTGDLGARRKDVLENRLKSLVCKNIIPLREAQTAIAADWVLAYKKYVLSIKKQSKVDSY